MLSLLDIAERTQKGPKIDEKAWNMGLFRKMNELARRYDIRYPGDGSWFNQDDRLVKGVFDAAVDFLTEVGVYCLSTGRVIQLTRQEVLEAIREAPREVVVGEGRDARLMKARRIEEREGLNHVPGLHAPFSEEMAPLAVSNFAQVASADYLEGFNFRYTDGREIFGMPLEAYAARRELSWMREGVRKAGKPGMGICFYPINTRAAVLIAAMDPDYGLRRTDGCLLIVLPDVKIEHDMLTAAIVFDDFGCFRVGAAHAIAGGFCGGVEGAAIEAVARGIAGWICYHSAINGSGVGDVTSAAAKQFKPYPRLSWGTSLVCQAMNTYCGTILYYGRYTLSGPGTETCLLEVALNMAQAPTNGCNLMFPRQERAQIDAAQTPLEAEWGWEVAQAVMRNRLTRAQVSELCSGIAGLLEGRPTEPAVPVRECYDWVHHRPSLAYREVYQRAKEKVAACGLNFA
jgi:hypothetical protein